jgi:hypothetical protein
MSADKQHLTQREDFPIKTMLYVENKLGGIRKAVMAAAARIAATDCANAPVYRVESHHVDRAIEELSISSCVMEK